MLYAAQKAIGSRQLNDEEAKDTARRAFQNNPKLTSKIIGASIGRSRRAVDSYLSDLRAATQFDFNLKILRMNRLDIPQERIAQRFGMDQKTISNHSGEKATLTTS
ncbi:MAG: hypothetical protein JW927_13715 [Deltaproteobacteria bacterium]|nr:hypothetical protein [Deltaproteobacteria bacterium]